LQAIKEVNYGGWLVVEAFSEKLPAAHIWRKMFNSERELVEKSFKMLNGK
jgi:D-psicose/D-tagatose/L-ribulose 3-epimerase